MRQQGKRMTSGTEFIREGGISDHANPVDVPSPSRMNSLLHEI